MSYLTFKANDASISSTFTPNWASIGAGGMQYRAVGATEWTNATAGVAIPVDTVGIELKADTINTFNTPFNMTGSISASGDVTSLTNGVGGDCGLKAVCYNNMFQSCTSLTAAPELPSTTLVDRCYQYMFYGCTSLTAAPALPATTAAYSCYWGMFSKCTLLTTPPALPATTMADWCYGYMFQGCTSLTVVPALPATTLAYACYAYMFDGCTSLIGYTTPEPGYTLIHNHPTTSITDWNYKMYTNINPASTVPGYPSSNTNYYFKPIPSPPPTIVGKRLECVGAGYYIG